MSSSSIVFQLTAFTQQYTFYSTTIILIIGFIGNILNIIVFLNLKIFRKNQCAFYLIIECLTNTVELILLFLIRTLTRINNGVEVANESLLWCKLRTVIAVPAALLSFSIVCFAAYDQFLSTSHRFTLRQMSTYKLAQYLTLTALILHIIHTIPFAIFLDINSSSICGISNPTFNQYYQFFYYPIFIGFLPISVSSVFSFLAFRNVRRLVRLQVPVIRRRLDRQLTAMILIRTAAFIILVSPYTIYRIYWLQINLQYVEPFRSAVENLVLGIVVSLYNLNFAVSFYIFLISSSRFRHQVKYVLVKKLWRRWERWCCSTRNQIVPYAGPSINSSTES